MLWIPVFQHPGLLRFGSSESAGWVCTGQKDTERAGPRRSTYHLQSAAIPSYRPLRNNHELFKTAHLVNDGYAVAWGDDSLDMSAETIENIAQESLSPQDFADFLIRNNLTQAAAASILGRSRYWSVSTSVAGFENNSGLL